MTGEISIAEIVEEFGKTKIIERREERGEKKKKEVLDSVDPWRCRCFLL